MEEVFTQCVVGGPVFVYVKNGRITRIRPLIFDETDPQPWEIEARGKIFSPPRMANIAPYVLTEKMRVYSDNRLRYPMKRVDFDPEGDRRPENRGKSGYERISWEEALDIVASEIQRIRKKYGPAAVAACTSSHHNWGLLTYKTGPFARFWNMLGYTAVFDNPDSWEGWHWGAIHTWGYYWSLGHVKNFDLLEDALQNTEMIVFWSVDPNTTVGAYAGQESARWRFWLKELGVKMVFIDPYCNYTAAVIADKWLAPYPGTDAALAEAIAYVWIKEGTYDKWFVENRTVGFEEFKKHILGEEDGVPRTPEWAEEICGVPASDIRALAKEWARRRTILACGSIGGSGGACRTPYAHEWARLMVLLMAMQGIGKPGVNIWGGAAQAAPMDWYFDFPGYSSARGAFNIVAKNKPVNPVSQRVYRLLLPEAILCPPVHWLGEGFCGESIEQQFKRYVCPDPGPGGAPIRMLYRHGGSFISTMTETNRWVKMYQSPSLEFVVAQDCWWQPETRFADIILPACTNFEQEDISEWSSSGAGMRYQPPGYGQNLSISRVGWRIIVYQKKCIEPLWESKPDYWIYSELADRLGFKEKYTEGKTIEEWIMEVFYNSSLPNYTTWEEFKRKGYFVVPPPPKDHKRTVSLRWFYEGRPDDTPDAGNPKRGTEKAHELATYSGKIEFVSQSLLKHFPDDSERPPLPRYISPWEICDPELAKKYPLLLLIPHARYSYHTHHDNKCPWLDEIPGHRIIKDGYAWWPLRIHPMDAEARGIKNGDIVKVYNDRGAVLCIAVVTERVRPGVVHAYHASAKYDPLEPGKPGSIDRGGCMNLLTPSRFMSKNAPGMVVNGVRVEVEKWEG
ncbi:MAG: molybdopterin-dependent oxidoreductase [Candidatus Bathyarchaeia archaeon]